MRSFDCPPSEGGNRTALVIPFLEAPQPDPAKAAVHLLPVPFEATVSYGGGTAAGPRAILEASFQLELFDREFDCEPGMLYGVYTHPEVHLPSAPEQAMLRLAQEVERAFRPGHLLGVLGGEHSITAPVVKGVLKHLPGPITVVQIDAHADLRDSYEDSRYSHASVARRLLENDRVEQILQLGIRSLCTEESEVIKTEPRVRTWYSEEVRAGQHWEEFCQRVRGRTVYLTVDVDGFDPSIIPATGTPEPNGLSFSEGEEIFRVLAREAQVVAFDCVELAPISGLHAPDFIVAKLVYRLMNLILANVTKTLKSNQESEQNTKEERN